MKKKYQSEIKITDRKKEEKHSKIEKVEMRE